LVQGRIWEAACWAHVRRKFYDLLAAHKSPVAAEALERIGALYVIEKEIRGCSPEQRREVRTQQTRPLLESLKQWLEATLGKLSRKSDTALAVRYALGRVLKNLSKATEPVTTPNAKRARTQGAISWGNGEIRSVTTGGLKVALHIHNMLGHHASRSLGIAATHGFEDIAVVAHHAGAHVVGAFGTGNHVANGFVNRIDHNVKDGVVGCGSQLAMEVHIELPAELTVAQFLFLCDYHAFDFAEVIRGSAQRREHGDLRLKDSSDFGQVRTLRLTELHDGTERIKQSAKGVIEICNKSAAVKASLDGDHALLFEGTESFTQGKSACLKPFSHFTFWWEFVPGSEKTTENGLANLIGYRFMNAASIESGNLK
jgi:Transposase IS66 family